MKAELSPSCFCEAHRKLIPHCQDKWFKYWHQIKPWDIVAKEAWRIHYRKFHPLWDFTSPKGFAKRKRDFTVSPNSSLSYIICTYRTCYTKNTQVKPWIQYEIIFSLAYLVRRHSGVCQLSFSPLTWTSLKLTLYRKKTSSFLQVIFMVTIQMTTATYWLVNLQENKN